MWKKILPLAFFGSFIAITCSNVVSCNVIKQKQLSLNLNDWKNSWAFTTQNIWQGMGKDPTFLLKESNGIFLHEDGQPEKLGENLFNKFQNTSEHKSDPNILETYLQLRYFVPSIIFFNEKVYDSPLKSYESILKNFTITYSSLETKPRTKVIDDLAKEKELPDDQIGQVCELVWGTTQAGETLSAYFDVSITLNFVKKTLGGKFETVDGYYIEDNEGFQKEIKWTVGDYFYLSLF